MCVLCVAWVVCVFLHVAIVGCIVRCACCACCVLSVLCVLWFVCVVFHVCAVWCTCCALCFVCCVLRDVVSVRCVLRVVRCVG